MADQVGARARNQGDEPLCVALGSPELPVVMIEEKVLTSAPDTAPATSSPDVLGQNAAVEAARDLIELPLKHADLFFRIGAKPSGHDQAEDD